MIEFPSWCFSTPWKFWSGDRTSGSRGRVEPVSWWYLDRISMDGQHDGHVGWRRAGGETVVYWSRIEEKPDGPRSGTNEGCLTARRHDASSPAGGRYDVLVGCGACRELEHLVLSKHVTDQSACPERARAWMQLVMRYFGDSGGSRWVMGDGDGDSD